jgi:hypothetical protein
MGIKQSLIVRSGGWGFVLSEFKCRGVTWTGSSICGHLDMLEIHAWIQNVKGDPTQEGTIHSNPVEIKEKHAQRSSFLGPLD